MTPVEMLNQEMIDRLVDRKKSEELLLIFKKAIYEMASKRLATVDDYIRVAKQAIDDYERIKNEQA